MPEVQGPELRTDRPLHRQHFAHIAWLRTIKEKIEYKGMKNMRINFPVIEDLKMDVARAYRDAAAVGQHTQAVRAVFFIDPEGTIRAILYYPLSNGRNMDEIKRLLLAMQTSDEYKIATPANWQPGDEVIVPPPGSCGSRPMSASPPPTSRACAVSTGSCASSPAP
jgi:peroxiredoxin 2/4